MLGVSTPPVKIDTDGTLAANSDSIVASQKATRTFAQNQALKTKLFTFSHDTSLTGDQVITGIGFTPKKVIILAGGFSDPRAGIGFGDAVTNYTLFNRSAEIAGGWDLNTYIIQLQQAAGKYALGVISAVGADGCTITWSNSGSPTGTALLYGLAIG